MVASKYNETNLHTHFVYGSLGGIALNTAFPPAQFFAGTVLLLDDAGGTGIPGSYIRSGIPSGTPAWSPLSGAALDGTRRDIGPFTSQNIPASQTDLQTSLGSTFGGSWIARRAGSVTGISANIYPNAAGSSGTVVVAKNGVALTPTLAVDPAFPMSAVQYAAGLYTFVALDRLEMWISTPVGWTATASDLTAFFEAAC